MAVLTGSCGGDDLVTGTPGAVRTPLRRTTRVPADRRPGGRPLSYSGPARVRVSQVEHAPSAGQVRRRRAVAWVVLAVLAVGVVLGLLALRSAGSVGVPSGTGVVQVQAGESLSELAQRVAPSAPTAAVVQRILSLNGLVSAAVHPGDSLVVPVG